MLENALGWSVAVEVAGWIGASLILVSYALITARWLEPTASLYQWMNVVGAIGFCINGAWHHAYPSMTLNVIWLAIAVFGLLRGRRTRRKPR
jgi:hypothetical protein